MMRISHSINESELEHTVNWHFSVGGLQAVRVFNPIQLLFDRLPQLLLEAACAVSGAYIPGGSGQRLGGLLAAHQPNRRV